MSCKIYLVKSEGSYFPGSDVKGRVVCNFNNAESFRSIRIRLICKEHVEWYSNSTRYYGDNYVLAKEGILLGPENSEEYCKLERGLHSIPFSISLPDDIPSSFTGAYGYIEYTLKATVDIPFWADYTDKLTITVNSPLIYNVSSPDFPKKVAYSNEKTICCYCLSPGKLAMRVELPTTAFVSGETINFKVLVRNLTTTKVNNLKIKLKRIITYNPLQYYPTISETKNVVSSTEDGIEAQKEQIYDLSLMIPEDFETPNFSTCKLFGVEYKLHVSCRMLKGFSTLTVSVPGIKVGHVKCEADAVTVGDTILLTYRLARLE